MNGDRLNDYSLQLDGSDSDWNPNRMSARMQLPTSGSASSPHGYLLRFEGTEKEMRIRANRILRNRCARVIELDIDSHTSATGFVPAIFELNEVVDNGPASSVAETEADSSSRAGRRYTVPTVPSSYAIGIHGNQLVNITHNLLSNRGLQYEFVCGLRTDSVSVYVPADHNWWGSTDAPDIERRIFDFSDWNCYAQARYSPILTIARYDAPAEPVRYAALQDRSAATHAPWSPISSGGALGGMLTTNLIIPRRPRPYVVERDITVMPGATLTIEAGTLLQFHRDVGILVLGQLRALGRPGGGRIRMELYRGSNDADVHGGVQMGGPGVKADAYRLDYLGLGGVRLVNTPPLDSPRPQSFVRYALPNSKDDTTPGPNEGFLEVFNRSTSQWVPVWDSDFGVRNARVVCRQLGFDGDADADASVDTPDSAADVYLWRATHRLDMRFIRHWIQPFYCDGTERHIGECDFPGVHVVEPPMEHLLRESIYVYCPPVPEAVRGWGGVR